MAIVLASASRTRQTMLHHAGVQLIVDAAAIDEAAIKESLAESRASPGAVAEALAEVKAKCISPRHSGQIVVGADQVLECDGRIFEKPANLDIAREQLLALRGRPHRLISSAVALRDGVR